MILKKSSDYVNWKLFIRKKEYPKMSFKFICYEQIEIRVVFTSDQWIILCVCSVFTTYTLVVYKESLFRVIFIYGVFVITLNLGGLVPTIQS